MRDKIRTCIFKPYRKGHGPTYRLTVYATSKTDWRGQTILAYTLTEFDLGLGMVIFDGTDFTGSPMHADDSDDTIKALMGFLCLKLGDTDREYFKDYTKLQEIFRDTHAESLQMEVYNRFGWDD